MCALNRLADTPAPGIECSFFRTALDNQPKPWRGSWDTLCRSLKQDRESGLHPADADPKRYLPAISGAAYPQGATRGCSNVQRIQLALIDIDNTEELPDPCGAKHPSGRPVMVKRPLDAPATMAPVCAELERLGIAAYAWSTWSSTSSEPRFRLLIPLAEPVLPEVWAQAGEWVLSVTGLNRWRRCIDLPVLRDMARIHFLPARKPGGPSVERREVRGDLLLPPTLDELTRMAPPKPEIQPWQAEILAKRQGDGITASGSGKCAWAKRFRGSDGRPVDLRSLDGVRLLESLGCRVGPARNGGVCVKHRTSCPWPSEHSHALDDDSGVLFIEAGRWPVWRCSHSHHAHLGLMDLLEAAGVLRAA